MEKRSVVLPPSLQKEFGVESAEVAPNFAVLSPQEFMWDFMLEASQSTRSVTAKAMLVEMDAVGGRLKRIYSHAIPQGTNKTLYADWFSLGVTSGQIHAVSALLGERESMNALTRAKEEMFKDFREVNTSVIITNPPTNIIRKLFPLIGNDHIKGVGIDDRIFYLGGINFSEENFAFADIILKFKNNVVAQKLSEQLDKASKTNSDYRLQLDDETQLLVDAGHPGESLILDTAVDLMEKEEIGIKGTSIFIPDGKVAEQLEHGWKKGLDVEVVTGKFPFYPLPIVNTYQFFWAVNEWSRLNLDTETRKYIVMENPFRIVHAKLWLFGDQKALFGSHNLSSAGVRAGTREWAILTSNKEIVGNLKRRYQDLRLEASDIAPLF